VVVTVLVTFGVVGALATAGVLPGVVTVRTAVTVRVLVIVTTFVGPATVLLTVMVFVVPQPTRAAVTPSTTQRRLTRAA
jgi:hypothetical protein